MDFKIKEAAAELRISESQLRNLVNLRSIGYYLIGNRYRFTREHLDAFRKRNEVRAKL